jgi:peptidoglycan/xylan/chitin deacetylase (PgdA/CDA1 family)
MAYLARTPWLFKKIFPAYTWEINTREKILYLSFDDGPHPEATPFVLDLLLQYDAKASFFCIGKNVELFPGIYDRIIAEGHAVGNHTQDHLNGWRVTDEAYINNVSSASKTIGSKLFRPPYGRIRSSQAKKLAKDYKIIMWTVLSGDFDNNLSEKKCLENVTNNSRPGSIIVFHDSEKAFPLLRYTLPEVLRFFADKGYLFGKITV